MAKRKLQKADRDTINAKEKKRNSESMDFDGDNDDDDDDDDDDEMMMRRRRRRRRRRGGGG